MHSTPRSSVQTLLLSAALCTNVAVAQDVVSSQGPFGTSALGVAPLASGALVGLQRTNSAVSWFVVAPDGTIGTPTALPMGSGYGESPRVVPDGAGGALILFTDLAGGPGGPTLGGYDAVVQRVDDAGQVTWTRRFGGSGNDIGRSILAAGAGGFFLAGDTTSAGFGNASGHPRDGFVARIDAAGNVQWVERRGAFDRYGRIDALADDGSGGVLCAGAFEDYTWVPVTANGFVLRLQANGQQVFQFPAGAGGPLDDVERTSNGGYVVIATSPFGGQWCNGYSAQGSILWNVPLDASGSNSAWLADLARTDDGTFLLGGNQAGSPALAHVRAFDETGTVLWDRSYPRPLVHLGSSLTSLTLDGYGSLYASGSVNVGAPTPSSWTGRIERIALATVGVQACAGRPNSTGAAARTRAIGSLLRTDDGVTLFTDGLPATTTGYYLASRTAGFVPGAGGSQGDLCLGGAIGRLNRPGETVSSMGLGRIHLRLDLDDLPSPTGSLSALAGETWRFQAWYRDSNPSTTSNFSSTVSVTLQ